jgi:hypothetical protein
MSSPSVTGFVLRAAVVRDLCARPAVLRQLETAVPAGLGVGDARARAVADGVARVLTLAVALDEGAAPPAQDRSLLHEAEERMWDPVDPAVARLVRAHGPDALLALYVLEAAVRREAWRNDTRRRRKRREQPRVPLEPSTAPRPDEREPLDLTAFRLEVERVAAATAQTVGIRHDEALALILGEVSYTAVAARHGRSSNGLWMALSRLRPGWRDLAERGRAAGLGGGLATDLSERVERGVRRAIRWRLIGGLTAALLLAAASGAAVTTAVLQGAPPAATAQRGGEEIPPPQEEGVATQIGRLGALELGRRLGSSGRPPRATPIATDRTRTGQTAGVAAMPPAGGTPPAAAGAPRSPAAHAAAADSCGFGTAALLC